MLSDRVGKKLDEPRYGATLPRSQLPRCVKGTWCWSKRFTSFRWIEVIEGVDSVDESAITGESAPVIRESGGDRSSIIGGTRVLSDWLIVRVPADPGETFLDRMIALVEGAKRQKPPNKIALGILLAALTIIFLVVGVTLLPFSIYSVGAAGQGNPMTITVLVALFVCLIPRTIGGLLSAIGIAGMDRMLWANVIATKSNTAFVEAHHKGGTVTFRRRSKRGNRWTKSFTRPAPRRKI